MTLSIWSGSAWSSVAGVNAWNGSNWQPAIAGKVWNGTAWVDFLYRDTQAVTIGSISGGSDPYYTQYWGFSSVAPVMGSISDGTSNVLGGATIVTVQYYENVQVVAPYGGSVDWVFTFTVNALKPNSGWSSLISPAASSSSRYWPRASANWSQASGRTTWAWSGNYFTSSSTGAFYPFGASPTTMYWV